MANEQYANGNNEQYGTVPSGGEGLPSGVILMWSGTVASIPAGFAFCDGQNGTPDLRDRFVVCAQQDDGGVARANPDGTGLTQSGGDSSHRHGFFTDGHDHYIMQAFNAASGTAGSVGTFHTEESYDSGTTEYETTIPPFYALAYIMKL